MRRAADLFTSAPQFRWRTVLVLLAVGVVAGAVAALIDLNVGASDVSVVAVALLVVLPLIVYLIQIKTGRR